MKRIISVVLMVLLVFPVLSACSSVQATSAPTETAAPPPTDTPVPPTETPTTPTNTPEPTATTIPPTEVPIIRQKVDMGGYEMYIACKGEGSPTVLLINGYFNWSIQWTDVFKSLNTEPGMRVCLYDRPGSNYSQQSPQKPRTAQYFAENLYTLLNKAGIEGPYVPVGVDLGVSIAELFAHQYSEEVVGMVAIELPMALFVDRLLNVGLPPETEDEHPSITKIRNDYGAYLGDPMKQLEYYDYTTSLAQLEAIGDLGHLPLIVVASDINNPKPFIDQWMLHYGADTPMDVLLNIESERKLLYEELAALSSQGELVIIEDSGVDVVSTQPDRVAEVIESMIELVQGE